MEQIGPVSSAVCQRAGEDESRTRQNMRGGEESPKGNYLGGVKVS